MRRARGAKYSQVTVAPPKLRRKSTPRCVRIFRARFYVGGRDRPLEPASHPGNESRLLPEISGRAPGESSLRLDKFAGRGSTGSPSPRIFTWMAGGHRRPLQIRHTPRILSLQEWRADRLALRPDRCPRQKHADIR